MNTNQKEKHDGGEDSIVRPHLAALKPTEDGRVLCSGEINLTASPHTAGNGAESHGQEDEILMIDDGFVLSPEPDSGSDADMKQAAGPAIVPVTAVVPATSHYTWRPSEQYLPFGLPRDNRGDAATWSAGAAKGFVGLKDLQRIHRLLRGRYLWAIVLSVVLGSTGAYIGFRSGAKTYCSTGIIRVMPTVPKVMYAVDEKGTLPMYETFVDAQIALLKSQRVIEQAMDEPAWQEIRQNSDKSDAALASFSDGLQITRQGELIWVRAMNVDPQISVAAVKSTIAAYLKVYAQLEAESGDKRRELREALQARLKVEYTSLRDEIQSLAKTYGTDDLKRQFQFKQEERNRLETVIRDTKMSLAMMSQIKVAPTTQPGITNPEDLLFRYHDSRAVQLSDRLAQCKEEVEEMRRTRGSGSGAFAAAQARLDTAQEQLNRYVGRYDKYLRDFPPTIDTNDPRELEARAEALEVLYEKANAEMLALGKQELKISELRDRAAEVKQKLDEATRAIEQLEVESHAMGRVVVMGQGDRPLGPYRDTRASSAAAGGLAGFGCGFGAILILGLLNSRLERPDDVDSHGASLPLLGLVPVLPEDLADPEQAALAAHCVHEIRTRLQILGQGQRRLTFGITSATAGAGKTSLTLALGLSFAAAHQRTLLIDCDVVGGGLTRKIDAIARRRLGVILFQAGLVNEQELARGVRSASASGQPLGQALIDLGYITPESLSQAVDAQQQETMGVLEALEGHDVLSCVASTGMNGLFVMPLGNAMARDAAGISLAGFRRLLDTASRSFDVILVDTGPILGSLEAAVVASQTDAVVLAVAKGDTRTMIEKSMAQLSVVGATMAGMVFNRARGQDVIAYSGSGSSKSLRMGSDANMVEHAEVAGALRLGPMARAVASWSPAFGVDSRRTRTAEPAHDVETTTVN